MKLSRKDFGKYKIADKNYEAFNFQ